MKHFIYNFTEINIETGKERLNADKFKKLDISKVTKIASEIFANSTLPAEVTFPSVVELETNSFKSVSGLKTLILPSLNAVQINIINNQAFGDNNYQTSVNALKVNEDTAYALKNYFVNNSVKVKPIKASSGTLDNVVISGKKGASLSQDIVIKMENEYFNNLNDVTHWFTNLPDGLTAKSKDKPKGELKQVIVTISGTPKKIKL